VVVLTADASTGLEHRLRESGATGYLTKPLDIDQVLHYLDEVARASDSGPQPRGGAESLR
jgi:CheY-like chemotaxis protein